MTHKSFQENLATLGFPVLESGEGAATANMTVAQVVRSGNIRLWEGFPVMLANSLKNQWFNYTHVRTLLRSAKQKDMLDCLVAISLALYDTLQIKVDGTERFRRDLNLSNQMFSRCLDALRDNLTLPVPCQTLSPKRLKNTFVRYYEEALLKVSEILSLKENFDLQRSLSQIFSQKQKELVLKKLRGEALTKTEREYYSRTVRKKLAALANPELHRLAQKLL